MSYRFISKAKLGGVKFGGGGMSWCSSYCILEGKLTFDFEEIEAQKEPMTMSQIKKKTEIIITPIVTSSEGDTFRRSRIISTVIVDIAANSKNADVMMIDRVQEYLIV